MATAPKQTTPYLRQVGTGHIYAWTPQLANRHDMAPHDEEAAKVQAEALRRRIERLQAAQAAGRHAEDGVADSEIAKTRMNAQKLAQLEAEVGTLEEEQRVREESARKAREAKERGEAPPKEPEASLSPEEKEEKRLKSLVDEDPEIKKIKAMKSKAEVCEYMAENYGAERDPEAAKLDPLREEALNLREARILELDRLNNS